MLRLSREALPMRRGSYRVQRLSVKRNTSQTDQAGKYFLLTFERACFGPEVESRTPGLRHLLGQMRSRNPTP